eukprot:1922740-Amphidinium_carterae.1
MATFETYAAEADHTIEGALGKSLDMLHAEGYQRAMKKLRMPLYKAGIGLNHSAVTPVSMMALPHSTALVHRASLQWWLTPFGQFLPDPAHGQHSSTCAKGPVRYRHDSLKHTWARLIRMAGWH